MLNCNFPALFVHSDITTSDLESLGPNHWTMEVFLLTVGGWFSYHAFEVFTFTSWFISRVLYVMVISSTIFEVSVRFDTNIVAIVRYESQFLRHCLIWAQCCDPELTMSMGCNPITAHQCIMHWAIAIQQRPTWINHTEIEKISDSGGDHYQLSSWWTLMRWFQCYIYCSLSCKRLALAKYVKEMLRV